MEGRGKGPAELGQRSPSASWARSLPPARIRTPGPLGDVLCGEKGSLQKCWANHKVSTLNEKLLCLSPKKVP